MGSYPEGYLFLIHIARETEIERV